MSGGETTARVAGDVEPMLTFAEVCSLLRIGHRTARRWLSAGKLPAPDFLLAGTAARWKASTIQGWLDSQGGGDARPRRIGRPIVRNRRGQFEEAAN